MTISGLDENVSANQFGREKQFQLEELPFNKYHVTPPASERIRKAEVVE